MVLFVAVAITAAWTALISFGVIRGMEFGTANYIGQAMQSGIVGLLVLLGLLALLVGLLVLPRGTEPDPTPWPPK